MYLILRRDARHCQAHAKTSPSVIYPFLPAVENFFIAVPSLE
jgi:hypothetical protein